MSDGAQTPYAFKLVDPQTMAIISHLEVLAGSPGEAVSKAARLAGAATVVLDDETPDEAP